MPLAISWQMNDCAFLLNNIPEKIPLITRDSSENVFELPKRELSKNLFDLQLTSYIDKLGIDLG